jgi:hypothetical protein
MESINRIVSVTKKDFIMKFLRPLRYFSFIHLTNSCFGKKHNLSLVSPLTNPDFQPVLEQDIQQSKNVLFLIVIQLPSLHSGGFV